MDRCKQWHTLYLSPSPVNYSNTCQLRPSVSSCMQKRAETLFCIYLCLSWQLRSLHFVTVSEYCATCCNGHFSHHYTVGSTFKFWILFWIGNIQVLKLWNIVNRKKKKKMFNTLNLTITRFILKCRKICYIVHVNHFAVCPDDTWMEFDLTWLVCTLVESTPARVHTVTNAQAKKVPCNCEIRVNISSDRSIFTSTLRVLDSALDG